MAVEYEGDMSPGEAMALLEANKDAILVDVRTQAEWSFVGVPDLSSIGAKPIFLEWQTYPSMSLNPTFVADLRHELERRGTPKDAPILFLCRSGVRSKAAAQVMTTEGHTRCLNVVGGFEGGPDPSRHRGMVDGWKALDLPWVQP